MKSILKFIVIISVIYFAVAGGIFFLISEHFRKENGMKKIVINRITADVEAGGAAELDAYRREYGARAVPDEIRQFEPDKLPDITEAEQAYIRPLIAEGDKVTGFIYFIYRSDDKRFSLEMAGVILLISYFAVMAVVLIGYHEMIKPFIRLSEYPERIAKGRADMGIPETRQRLFGKYIWGMNMLKDEMKHKEKSLNEMEKEKQTLIISIAHGIKTPLSNIKLYAEAIERGIYHEDKLPNQKDAETAAKINRNVEKVETLVKDIMDRSAQYNVDYQPEISSFYLSELMEMVKTEYSGRFQLLHIPVETVCENDPLVTSDKEGIFTIISQLIENAIKYGSGEKISITMGRQDEDVFFTVKNKGNVLTEEETAYVFKSFWRGSNSQNTEGQGVGLYVARRMAESLSGDIFMKVWESEDMTEVTLILPISV